MKEHPILFSGPMVRAILEGRKTQTRRPVKARRGESVGIYFGGDRTEVVRCDADRDPIDAPPIRCPYGEPGDRLWVKETFAETDGRYSVVPIAYRADGEQQDGVWKWTPSIFMSRDCSRITLEVLSVRVQRLQDITEEDAHAEGMEPKYPPTVRNPHSILFEITWDAINGKRAQWASNPWVWAVEFRRVGP